MSLFLAAAAAPTSATLLFLILAIGLALSFEFVNGFHDTANAVATVIYTNTLPATPAVVWSGLWNLIGVLFSSGAVAFGIVSLLPAELVINIGSTAGFAMIFALLFSAILWNVGTWYVGLPASSSHTLIGSIIGVGMANALMHGGMAALAGGVNWTKVKEVGAALLLSPVVGFVCAALLLLLAKALIRNPSLYKAPEGKTPPPWWIRGILLFSCTGVSFAHGSNDGQKGMGLIVLILVGILPGFYALQMDTPPAEIHHAAASAQELGRFFTAKAGDEVVPQAEATKLISSHLESGAAITPRVYAALAAKCGEITNDLSDLQSFQDLPEKQRGDLRTDFYLIAAALKNMKPADQAGETQPADFVREAEKFTNYIPAWIKYAVALALGLGTMIGYKRIVVTIGEKIGRSHLTYAQGAAAEMVAMGTILLANRLGLPVSTTHVLSSGVAGTMAANRSGLQTRTLRNILLAWVLTLPVCIFLGALFFALGLNLLFLIGLK